MKQDPKYSGIPNINFSLTTPDDKRENKFAKQRIKRGFDDSEMWSLANTIASFIIPRLKHFKDTHVGTPTIFETEEEWELVLQKMIDSFELVNRNNGTWNFDDKEQLDLENGLKLFSEHFLNLWD